MWVRFPPGPQGTSTKCIKDCKFNIYGHSVKRKKSPSKSREIVDSHSKDDWIIKNEIRWADQWDKKQIDRGRANDSATKNQYYEKTKKIKKKNPLAVFCRS